MKNKPLLLLSFLFIVWISGCALSADPTVAGQNASSGSSPSQPGSSSAPAAFVRDTLANYSATFEVRFQGPANWVYQLRTRRSSATHEQNLHIDGVDKAHNPGDIRMVTDGANTWMTGPGTDNECVQFPNNQGMDPTFIYPDTLVSAQELSSLMHLVGEETVAGKAALHYTGSGPSIGNWKDAKVDVWQDKASKELLRFYFQGAGTDTLFGAGSGKIAARYEVNDLRPVTIQPVEGCALSVPLPDTAKKLVRLPGMASFESSASMADISSFYQTALGQEGWTPKEPPAQTEGATELSYTRGTEEAQVHIEAAASGSKVKLLFTQGQ